MLLLTSVNDRLQIVTTTAATIDVHATWVDTNMTGPTITPGRTNTAIIAAGTTSVAGAPAASTQRNVKTLHVRNKHATLASDVTVQHTDGTVIAQLYKTSLAPGEMVQYTDQGGFLIVRPTVAIAGQVPGQCRLILDSATALRLNPYNGTQIIINSQPVVIPDAGITLPSTGLSPGTAYFIYAYMNAGVLTLESSTTGYSSQPGTGIKIKTGDPTRTLVGFASILGSAGAPTFADNANQRYVRSWYNEKPLAVQGISSSSIYLSLVGAWYDFGGAPSHMQFLAWAGEAWEFSANFVSSTLAIGTDARVGISIDNAAPVTMSFVYSQQISYFEAQATNAVYQPAIEGAHYASPQIFMNTANSAMFCHEACLIGSRV